MDTFIGLFILAFAAVVGVLTILAFEAYFAVLNFQTWARAARAWLGFQWRRFLYWAVPRVEVRFDWRRPLLGVETRTLRGRLRVLSGLAWRQLDVLLYPFPCVQVRVSWRLEEQTWTPK
jgi:hypothetical protein